MKKRIKKRGNNSSYSQDYIVLSDFLINLFESSRDYNFFLFYDDLFKTSQSPRIKIDWASGKLEVCQYFGKSFLNICY